MKVGIILVYVGEVLPEYFELWVKSAENNPEFDFYVFTDRAFEQYEFHIQCPKNVYWIVMDFRTIKERIQKHVDFKIHLKTAYKLCDYKPLYGLAFEDYLMGYDWWGHCDGDIIFGSLKNFITDEKLRRYEKIYRLGHLTLYKNEDKINHLWKADVDGANYYKHVYRLGYSMFFDEDFGINRIAEHCQIKCLNDVDCADIWIGKNRFWTYWDREYGQYDHLFSLEDGHLYGYIACEEKIIKKNMHMHIFKKERCPIYLIFATK